jgi:hypothetical protein
MPTYICRPKADYSNAGGWVINGATTLWGALTSEDDSTSHIQNTHINRAYHADLDHPSVGTVNASTLYVRARDAAGTTPTLTYGTSLAGTFKDTDTFTLSGSWGQKTASITPLPGDMNQAHFGVGVETDGTNPLDVRVSWIRLDLSYSPPTGEGYAYLIASFLGPLVAVGLAEMPGLVRYFNAKAAAAHWLDPWSRHRLDVADAVKMWDSLRLQPWRVYSY